ncbi:MAG: YbjN domain-containing protein [Parvibaculaceae bacterium]
MTALLALPLGDPNPLDTIEELATAHDWFVDRATDDEVNIIVEGSWGDLYLCLTWRDDLEGLHVSCSYDLKIPPHRREEACRLASLINEQLYFGHFDVWRKEGTLLYRNGLVLSGGSQATRAQCESLISLALDTCERYFPTFQFVIWAGQRGEEALQASLLETVGEA